MPRLTEFNNTPIPLSRHELIPPHNNTSLPISFVPPSSNSRRGTAAVRHCPISDQTSSITATTKCKKSISKSKTECTHTVEILIPRPYSKSFAHPTRNGRNRFANALTNWRSMSDGTKHRKGISKAAYSERMKECIQPIPHTSREGWVLHTTSNTSRPGQSAVSMHLHQVPDDGSARYIQY